MGLLDVCLSHCHHSVGIFGLTIDPIFDRKAWPNREYVLVCFWDFYQQPDVQRRTDVVELEKGLDSTAHR